MSGAPIGTVIAWFGTKVPVGYLECAGQILSKIHIPIFLRYWGIYMMAQLNWILISLNYLTIGGNFCVAGIMGGVLIKIVIWEANKGMQYEILRGDLQLQGQSLGKQLAELSS